MKKFTAIAIVLLTLLFAAASLAAETSPWMLDQPARARREDLGRIPKFGNVRGVKDVGASSSWLRQARINGYFLNLRLFAPDGESRMFQERLEVMTPGTSDLRLYLLQQTTEGGIMLQVDARALEILSDYGIREIQLADGEFYLQNTFTVAELKAMRAELGLADGEQLCVGAEEDPVMVVSETGRRRYVTE